MHSKVGNKKKITSVGDRGAVPVPAGGAGCSIGLACSPLGVATVIFAAAEGLLRTPLSGMLEEPELN
jgi:hypothetical protein